VPLWRRERLAPSSPIRPSVGQHEAPTARYRCRRRRHLGQQEGLHPHLNRFPIMLLPTGHLAPLQGFIARTMTHRRWALQLFCLSLIQQLKAQDMLDNESSYRSLYL